MDGESAHTLSGAFRRPRYPSSASRRAWYQTSGLSTAPDLVVFTHVSVRSPSHRAFLAVTVLAILVATLLPQDPAGPRELEKIVCLFCGYAALADALCNLVLFLPLGGALALLGWAFRPAVLTAAGMSLSIEIAQFAIPGRDPSLGDVTFNSLGAMLGFVLVRLGPRLTRPSVRIAGRLSLASAVGVGAVLVLTDALLRPALPETTYFGGAAELHTSARPLRLGGSTEPGESFRGRIDDVRIYNIARTQAELASDMTTAVAAGRATPGLVAAYNFDEGTSTLLTDRSGLGNDGLVRGATWSSQGRFGGALSFERAGDVVLIPSTPPLELTAAMTLEAWIFPTASQHGWHPIIQKEFDDYFLLASSRFGALTPAAGGTFGASTESLPASSAVPPNQWTHVALTYGHSRVEFYINGRSVARRLRWYPGRVISARLDGLPIRAGISDVSRQLRAGLLSGSPLTVAAVAAEPTRTLVPLVTLHDAERNEMLLLAAEADGMIVRLRSRAAAIGLDDPGLRAPGALRGLMPGDPLALSVSRHDGDYCVTVNGRATCGLRFTIGLGWTFLASSQVPPGWLRTALNAIWLAGLAVPFGFWARWRWESAFGGLVIVLAILFVCNDGSLSAPTEELLSLVFGFLTGILGGSLPNRRRAEFARGERNSFGEL